MEPEDNALSDDDLPSSVPDFVRTYISCSICHCMQTEWRDLSPSCPHSICKCCLDRWDQKIPKHCPECRMEFTMESVRPSVKLNSFAAHVTVRCVKVGRRNGCSWEGTYESRAGHKRECEFQPLPCPHEGEGCPEHPLRKDVQSHAASCPYRLLPCCHPGCSRQFQARHEGDKVAHEGDCEFRPVSCDFCGESEVQRQLANHLEICPKAMVSCSSEALEEVAKTVTSGVPKDDVRAQVLPFASLCTWKGTRGTLTEHRSTCFAYMSCIAQARQLENTYVRFCELESTCAELRRTVSSLSVKNFTKTNYLDKHCLVCAKCQSKQKDGFSVVDLNAAASSCFLDCVKCILTTSEFLLREVDNKGRTVFHAAASGYEGCVNIVKYIVEEKGCSDMIPNTTNTGETVLHVAASHGNVGFLRY
eukprot:Rmarinus@m.6830